jgi:hypothetical protein
LTTGDIESSRPLSATIHGELACAEHAEIQCTRYSRISRNDILISGYFPW